MAKIFIGHLDTLGVDDVLTKVEVVIAKDKDFKEKIDTFYKDRGELKIINNNLLLPDEDFIPYKNLEEIHSKIRVYFGKGKSRWHILPIANQNMQSIKVEKEDGTIVDLGVRNVKDDIQDDYELSESGANPG